MVGNGLSLSGCIGAPGPMLTGVQEPMLERPVLAKVHPPVVFLLPAAMAELANYSRGKGGLRQSRDPQPFVIGTISASLALAITIPFQYLFRAHHAHRLGIIDGERQALGVPKLNPIGLVILGFRERGVRRTARKQAYRRWIQIAGVLFEADAALGIASKQAHASPQSTQSQTPPG